MATAPTSRIERTPGVCGGDARVAGTRIPVWLLADYPGLTPADLDAAWANYRDRPVEVEQAIWFNDTAADVPDGQRPPARVIVAGRLLGLSEDEIRGAFEPPLGPGTSTAPFTGLPAQRS